MYSSWNYLINLIYEQEFDRNLIVIHFIQYNAERIYDII